MSHGLVMAKRLRFSLAVSFALEEKRLFLVVELASPLVGQSTWGPLLASAEHPKDRIQLLHRDEVHFRRAEHL